INIHPSLLPQFPGLNTHQRAITAGDREHGASVHFVTADIDSGPIIIQRTVPIDAADTPETLARKVLVQEHQIYPLAIKWFAESRLQVLAGRVLLDGENQPQQGLKTGPDKQNN
ncbi:MAG: phosphoribosylglycinamide formyltransferase, partial [Acidiferrobacterales bacterium]